MSDTSEFLHGYDPEAVDKLGNLLNPTPLNRTMGVRSSQRTHKPKAKESNTIDKIEGSEALKRIREEMNK